MEAEQTIRVLLVEDNVEYANAITTLLERGATGKVEFKVIWKSNGPQALEELSTRSKIDIILMDYFLPGQTGVQLTELLIERCVQIPIVFLTVNKEFELAVEVMRLGVEDYLLKNEVSLPDFAQSLLNAIDRKAQKDKPLMQEISAARLEVMQDLTVKIIDGIRPPMDSLRAIITELLGTIDAENLKLYLGFIRDNHARIENKMAKLKELHNDKTIPYIKDIRMFDLS